MLVALRATHEHLDLDVLDALTRGVDALDATLTELDQQRAADGADAERVLDGWVTVSTCNRLEVYLDARRFHDAVDLVIGAISRTSGLDEKLVALCFDAAMDAPVPRHLYEVTSGLRSLVLGEAEIAGQVRTAYERARREGTATSLLHDLFQHAFRSAKRVATQAPVGAAGRSGAAVALDRADAELGGIEGRRALIIGTGAYARLGVAELLRRGIERIQVHSPSGRALGFAERHGIEAVEAEGLDAAIAEADLILACSGRGISLFPERFLEAGRTVVLDLALHSDLHPLVRHLKGVTVLSLADLGAGSAQQDPVLHQAHEIVEETVEAFRLQQEVRRVDPAMAALRQRVADAADAEIDRMRHDVEGETADQLERSIRRILAKIMHRPAERARHLAETGYADDYVQAFHTIFGIDISDGETRDLHGGLEEDVMGGWMRVDQTVPPRPVAELTRIALAEAGRTAADQDAPAAQEPVLDEASAARTASALATAAEEAPAR